MEALQLVRMKFLVSTPLQYGIGDEALDIGDGWPQMIRISDIDSSGKLRIEDGKFISPEKARSYLLKEGDILLAAAGATVGKSYLHSNTQKPKAFASYLIRARFGGKIAKKFAYYYFQSSIFWHWIDTIAVQATIQNVSAAKYANLQIPLPPLEEQQAIAAFLDRETTKIDQQIAEIERLKCLLSERRHSVVSHAVLGQKVGKNIVNQMTCLPPNWPAARLRILGQIRLSNVDKHSNEDEVPVYLCNYVDVYKNEKIHSDLNFMKATSTALEIQKFQLQRGQILLTKDSESPDDIGNPAYVDFSDGHTLCGYHLAQFTPDERSLLGEFGRYCLASDVLNDQFKVGAKGVTRFAIGKREISDFIIPLPPLAEQRSIVDFLDNETSKIDGHIEQLDEVSGFLKEKRAALITAAVTGQSLII